MGGYSVNKFVKQTKVFCPWPPYQGGRGEILPTQTKSNVGTTAAWVLRKPDSTVWQELRGLNSADGVIDQLAEFVTLFFGDRGSQVLNFNQPLTDENNLG